jgi:hypothetical protein
MTAQYMNQSALESNISFVRPLLVETDKSMDIDIENDYMISLTWGIF